MRNMKKTPLMKYLELKFGKSIQELLSLGTVAEVAEYLKISKATISKWKKYGGT